MTNPIEKALNRLHEYAVLHPEHDTDGILTDARTYLKENPNEAIKELSQEESYVLWTSLNSEFKELRSGWDDFKDFDLFARAYISQCLKNQL